jgi:hypothetical protein
MTLELGIHDIPADRYHADQIGDEPSLSRSIAHKILSQSPLHAWHAHPRLNPDRQPIESGTLDNGSAAHALLFEGVEAFVVDADSWRTNAAKEQRAQARKDGLIPLLAHQAEEVNRMVSAIAAQLDQLDVTPRPFTDGKPEMTLVWRDRGVLCRARLDWLRDDFTFVDDLKSTGTTANPREWARRQIWGKGLDLQVAMYRRGVRVLKGIDAEFRFIVVENQVPYALSVVSLAPDALALADAKLDRALDVFRECRDTDLWPSYLPRVHYVEAPPWNEAEWLEQQALEEAAA